MADEEVIGEEPKPVKPKVGTSASGNTVATLTVLPDGALTFSVTRNGSTVHVFDYGPE